MLDASGAGSITTADIDNGSTDNCGIQSMSLSKTSFGCADVGANTVTLTVTDIHGNSATCTATVDVQDNIAPNALCKNVVVQLDSAGTGSITAADVDNGSNDACGIASLSVSPSSFDCSDVGNNTVTLTVTDNNGNTSTCTATVDVQDNIAPDAQCQNVTIS
ncbi:MAG: HYR domain-containing protein [Bacteroidia bacterium]